MAQRFGVDLSGWNLLTSTGILPSAVKRVSPSAIYIPDPEHDKQGRDYNPNAGRKSGIMASISNAVTTYVAPDFMKMRVEGWCHPEFIYIKCAHGTAGPGAPDQYPTKAYTIPARAAQAAGWAFGPYHYFYMDMNARNQAYAFYDSVIQACEGDLSLAGTLNPIVDLEDSASQMYKSFAWDGVSNPDRQIANVKYFLGSIFPLYLNTLDNVFNANFPGKYVLTQIYSGYWFWHLMYALLSLGNYPENLKILSYYNNRLALSAAYTPDHQPWPNITVKQTLEGCDNRVSQFTSTCIPPMAGCNLVSDGANLDLNQYLDIGDNMSHYQYWTGLAKLLPPIGEPPPPPPPPPDLTQLKLDVANLKSDVSNLIGEMADKQTRLETLEAWHDRVKAA